MAFDTIKEQWTKDVYMNDEATDLYCDEDYGSLAIGYGLGKGLQVTEAYDFYLELMREDLL